VSLHNLSVVVWRGKRAHVGGAAKVMGVMELGISNSGLKATFILRV
jgi:hypothetical protein